MSSNHPSKKRDSIHHTTIPKRRKRIDEETVTTDVINHDDEQELKLQQQLNEELANLPLAQREQLRKKGLLKETLNVKPKNYTINSTNDVTNMNFTTTTPTITNTTTNSTNNSNNNKRDKNAPIEKNSKYPVRKSTISITNPVSNNPTKHRLDPRFTSTEPISMKHFRQNFKFLDSNVQNEIQRLSTMVKTGYKKNPDNNKKKKRLSEDEIKELQSELTRLHQYRANSIRTDMLQERIDSEGGHVASKRIKKLEVQVKYDMMSQKPKKFEKYIDKKRRKAEKKQMGNAPPLGIE
jgi:hypothetical protein